MKNAVRFFWGDGKKSEFKASLQCSFLLASGGKEQQLEMLKANITEIQEKC